MTDFQLGVGTMTEPRTWEDAAERAAKLVWNRFEPKPSGVDGLSVTSRFFDHIAEEAFGQEHLHVEWTADRFANLAARALWGRPIATIDVWHKLRDVVDLIARKQHDYGHGNILRFGVDGIIVRLSDKMARLHNLTARNVKAANESLADTWDDVIGYSIIAVMLVHGTFELPLADDLFAEEAIRAGLSK